MGTRFRYYCSACGYTAEVSASRESDIHSLTQTVVCTTCRKLFNVRVGSVADETEYDLRCPKSASHPVAAWNPPGACPKCGKPMLRHKQHLKPNQLELLQEIVAQRCPMLLGRVQSADMSDLSRAERETIEDALGTEFMDSGLREDDESNPRGLEIEHLIDIILSPIVEGLL